MFSAEIRVVGFYTDRLLLSAKLEFLTKDLPLTKFS